MSQKFKIPYKVLTPEKTICPMTKLVWFIQSELNSEEKLHVTDLWVNEKTYEKLKEVFEEFVKKHVKGKVRIAKELAWYCLSVAPACDLKNEKNLEDDYIYLIKREEKRPFEKSNITEAEAEELHKQLLDSF